MPLFLRLYSTSSAIAFVFLSDFPVAMMKTSISLVSFEILRTSMSMPFLESTAFTISSILILSILNASFNNCPFLPSCQQIISCHYCIDVYRLAYAYEIEKRFIYCRYSRLVQIQKSFSPDFFHFFEIPGRFNHVCQIYYLLKLRHSGSTECMVSYGIQNVQVVYSVFLLCYACPNYSVVKIYRIANRKIFIMQIFSLYAL